GGGEHDCVQAHDILLSWTGGLCRNAWLGGGGNLRVGIRPGEACPPSDWPPLRRHSAALRSHAFTTKVALFTSPLAIALSSNFSINRSSLLKSGLIVRNLAAVSSEKQRSSA